MTTLLATTVILKLAITAFQHQQRPMRNQRLDSSSLRLRSNSSHRRSSPTLRQQDPNHQLLRQYFADHRHEISRNTAEVLDHVHHHHHQVHSHHPRRRHHHHQTNCQNQSYHLLDHRIMIQPLSRTNRFKVLTNQFQIPTTMILIAPWSIQIQMPPLTTMTAPAQNMVFSLSIGHYPRHTTRSRLLQAT